MKGQFMAFVVLLCISSYTGLAQNSLIGKITGTSSDDLLIGASVFLPELKTGASTDINGEYRIDNIPSGIYLTEVRYIGYKTVVKKIAIDGQTHVDFVLEPAVSELSELVVTGVAQATELKESPVIIKPIGADVLQGQSNLNLIDALRSVPGVDQITTGSGISKPVIRGLGYNRIVTLWNGIRQEGQQWGDEHGIEIDEYAIDRVEIIKGPGSLLYGSDAIAGVVNFLPPKSLPRDHMRTSLSTNYQSNNNLIGYSLANEGNKKGIHWTGRLTNKFAGNYANPYDGKVYNSGFREIDGSLSLGVARKWGYSDLSISTFNQRVGIVEGERDEDGRFQKITSDADGDLVEGTVTSKDLRGYAIGLPYQDIHHFRVVSNNNIILGNSSLRVDLGFQKNTRKEYADPLHPDEEELYMDLNTLNYSVKYRVPAMSGWEATLGIGGMIQENTNKGEEYLIPDYNSWDLGVFALTQKALNDKLTLAGGVRFDIKKMNTARLISEEEGVKFEGFEKFYDNFSGSIGLSYRPDDENTIKFNLSRGFRSPNISEIGSNGKHEGTFRYEYGNKNLKPEVSHQIDLGYFLNTDHVTFEATPFVNFLQDYIYLEKLTSLSGGDSIPDPEDPGTAAFRYAQGNAMLYGGEVYLDIHPHPWDWLHIENSFSFVRAIQANQPDSMRYLPFIPAPNYKGGVRAHFTNVGRLFSNAHIKFGMVHYFAQNQIFSAYDTETATSAYTLLNAGLGGDLNIFSANSSSKLSLLLTVENLANVAYQSHLSRLKYAPINPATGRYGVYNMGRNFSVKLVLSF